MADIDNSVLAFDISFPPAKFIQTRGVYISPPRLSVSVNLSQAFQFAVVLPRNIGDPPITFDLDEIEQDRHRFSLIDEFDCGLGFACASVADDDIEGGCVPVLRVKKRITVQEADFATPRRCSLVLGPGARSNVG